MERRVQRVERGNSQQARGKKRGIAPSAFSVDGQERKEPVSPLTSLSRRYWRGTPPLRIVSVTPLLPAYRTFPRLSTRGPEPSTHSPSLPAWTCVALPDM